MSKIFVTYHGIVAERIVCSIAASAPVEAMLRDTERLSPREIASFACDVAQAFISEIESREWIHHATDPAPPSEGQVLMTVDEVRK
jgi:hypothetical protein